MKRIACLLTWSADAFVNCRKPPTFGNYSYIFRLIAKITSTQTYYQHASHRDSPSPQTRYASRLIRLLLALGMKQKTTITSTGTKMCTPPCKLDQYCIGGIVLVTRFLKNKSNIIWIFLVWGKISLFFIGRKKRIINHPISTNITSLFDMIGKAPIPKFLLR